jgi:hypothetical protein
MICQWLACISAVLGANILIVSGSSSELNLYF